MSSTQFGNNDFAQPHPAYPPPAQWNVPPGAPGHYLPPNPQMWNAPMTQQWNNPAFTVIPHVTQPAAFHQEFLKGKPKALGIVLIVWGILHIAMGIGQLFTSFLTTVISGVAYWGAIFNIIAGSLTVAATSKPSMCLIQGSLGLSIVITIISVLGLTLNIVDYFSYYYCLGYYYYPCIIGGDVLRGFFIATYIVQFSICVRLAVVGCRAQKHSKSSVPTQVFLVQNGNAFLQTSAVPGSYPAYPPQ
ncbi:membrane-spanning 4-domains subfamily A member 18-like [Rana temporaria]|uniref:membrane-spanning 4-domains subfamily A member 18-like n=1 Tax=Rana temporaria TaxID=8407 RepID=UPI001AACA803|nr:membrane-spanning 4-domains subfamily A member 18-like [Rana temporaria]XP_040176964.1 membrane-spanning 4-domains subfamily A member 18-like [Rana temporaria]XP_040176965.1 membrane-spanning 4-domains subfamily A member 18-like [Rana temporaria]